MSRRSGYEPHSLFKLRPEPIYHRRTMIRVVGLGPGDPGRIPPANLEAIEEARRLILKTRRHPVTKWLAAKEIEFESCDDLYDAVSDSAELHEAVAERVISAGEGTVFAVPGSPLVAEETVRALALQVEVELFPAPSFLDAVLAEIGKPPADALQIWSARKPTQHLPDPRAAQIVHDLDSERAASGAKVWLLRFFPPEHPVLLVSRAGLPGAFVSEIPLRRLDSRSYDSQTSLYLEGLSLERPTGFYGLVAIVDRLLGPGGCPWDREQTHRTLKRHLLEETYETIEAIDSGDSKKLCEELGDYLLQALMHSQMDAQKEIYDIDDVVTGITRKLIHRHPHVFGDAEAATSEEVLRNWDRMKQKEKGGGPASILEGVPQSLPALFRAFEVSKRASRGGFDWPSLEAVFDKAEEEQRELRAAIESGEVERIEEEVGDLLFALANIARWLDVEPEDALRRMVRRFVARFQEMEARASKPLTELSAEEWDALWERAKASR